MLGLKHDIRINLKHEKEIFRLVWLLVFTFIFSMTLLGIADYIWNMTLWRIVIFLVPWAVAVPAIINLKLRHITFREIVGEHVLWQIGIGCIIGILLGAVWTLIDYQLSDGNPAMLYAESGWRILYIFLRYMCVVGPAEELVYRVAIMGSLEELFEKHRWLAPLIANSLFALVHIFQTSWSNVLFAFVFGGVYTLFVYKWKRCGLAMVAAMHGMFDFSISIIPFILFYVLG